MIPVSWARAIADRHRSRMGISVPYRRGLLLAAQSRGRRNGRRVAARNGGCVRGTAGRGAFTLFVGSILGSVGGLVSALSGEAPAAPVAENAAGAGETETYVLRTEVPFGPFLALAAGVFALFSTADQALVSWPLMGRGLFITLEEASRVRKNHRSRDARHSTRQGRPHRQRHP